MISVKALEFQRARRRQIDLSGTLNECWYKTAPDFCDTGVVSDGHIWGTRGRNHRPLIEAKLSGPIDARSNTLENRKPPSSPS
jgi:hypothetical protein